MMTGGKEGSSEEMRSPRKKKGREKNFLCTNPPIPILRGLTAVVLLFLRKNSCQGFITLGAIQVCLLWPSLDLVCHRCVVGG